MMDLMTGMEKEILNEYLLGKILKGQSKGHGRKAEREGQVLEGKIRSVW